MDVTSQVLADPGFQERYVLAEKLGEGGMGAVHRGTQRALNRPVAIKFMVPDLALEKGYVERFIAEARLAASLIHSNVVAVFDYGVAGQVPYLVTEFVAGRTLSDFLKERAPTVEETVAIGRQVLEGLDAIHKLGIVHRDIKPANILVGTGSPPAVKILDFGIAKQTTGALLGDSAPKTSTGLVMGTPEFMAPEQAVGDPLSPASDIYAFTLVLYRMIVGHAPFSADSVLALLRMQVHSQPDIPDDLLPAVRELLARGLAKSPAERIGTAAAMRQALDRAAAEAFATATFRKPAGGAVSHATEALPGSRDGFPNDAESGERGRDGAPASPTPPATAVPQSEIATRAAQAADGPDAAACGGGPPAARPALRAGSGQPAGRTGDPALEPVTVPSSPGTALTAPPDTPRSLAAPLAIGAVALVIAAGLFAVRARPTDAELVQRGEWDHVFASLPAVSLDPDENPPCTLKAKNVYRDENRLQDYAKEGHLTLKNPRALDGERIAADVVLAHPNSNLIRSGFRELVEAPEGSGKLHTVWASSRPLWLWPIGFALKSDSVGAVEMEWSGAQPRGKIELDLVGVRSADSATAVVYRLRVHLESPGYSVFVSDPARCSVTVVDDAREKRKYAFRDPWRAVTRYRVPHEALVPRGRASLEISAKQPCLLIVRAGGREQHVELPKPFALEPGYLYPRVQWYDKTDLCVERITMSGDIVRDH